ERTRALTVDQLYIDIGAKSKAEGEKLVEIGDYAAFDSEFVEFGDHKIKAKALDDRAGCAVIIEMLKSDYPFKLTAAFVTQEEVGLRGSMVAANQINGDLVINLEGTISADTMGIEDSKTVNIQGNGPSLSLLDRSSVYLKKYVEAAVSVAEKNNIPYQFRRSQMGGTDAGSYHTANGGTPVIGIAVPCRYIHSAVSVMDKRDYENYRKLVRALVFAYGNEEIL
ncbi:MAG: M28 family peptidase, partial [Clostridiales bacterium]|nr:M28 family peptidase [Clostridiales bacterium]